MGRNEASDEASDKARGERAERDLQAVLNDPALTPEDKQRILEALLGSLETSAGATRSPPKPLCDVEPRRAPGARDRSARSRAGVRPPVAGDLAAYTKDLVGNGPLVATIDTTLGAFHCELFADQAPMAVANFVGLATGKKTWANPVTGSIERGKPFYDGLIFHRVIPGFMIQGGDPLGCGTGGPGYEFDDEFDRGLTMKPGALAMANAGPATNGSQFFITEGSPSYLNNRHTIFGQCTEIDLVQRIAGVPTDARDRPEPPVTIRKITFSRH